MTDPIPPALSAAEWAKQLNDRGGLEIQAFPKECSISIQDWGAMSGVTVRSDDLPALIALANAALPDSDRRKFTRDTIEALRRAARCLREAPHGVSDDWRHMDAGWHTLAGSQRARHEGTALVLEALADALESYLPPTNA